MEEQVSLETVCAKPTVVITVLQGPTMRPLLLLVALAGLVSSQDVESDVGLSQQAGMTGATKLNEAPTDVNLPRRHVSESTRLL